MTILLLLSVAASAQPDAPVPAPAYRSTVQISPIGPVTAVIASATGMATFDTNLTFLHMPNDRVGLAVRADLLSTHISDIDVGHGRLEVGPRFALRKRGLNDWSLTPSVSLGYTAMSAADVHLAHYGVASLGLDAGRTWVWNRVSMDLGLGLYSARPFAYGSPTEVLEDQRPVSLSPIKPSVTWSLGYAF